ncbi:MULTISPECIES: ALF repeat-containing protein [unclassified Streptomyces]|uniref:ALF repeat-containing protein n=1 Tax=unclassified Streptomyces TaxID=2593676 RepID=UPI00136ED453|nr:ALF repeat-containing protein [Streptomyces sp. SID4982]MYS18212.1 hypothetical protein [Streptomyces sp. SID4982]
MRSTRAALLLATAALAPALLLTATPASAATPATTVSVTAGTPVDQMSDDDVRVAIARILADPKSGKAVIREANEALDGTIEDQRAFLETGYRLAQAEDDRVAVARILADPKAGPALRAAAAAVIDGTPEELRYFIEVGQYQVQ